jgi:DNA-binding transcriptional LysR family regulator
MDFYDLQSFALVVRHGGFSAAERATGETRGKLSKRVAKLEDELGTRLLERSTRSIRITDAGQQIYQQCEIIQQSLETTRAIAARTRDDVSGTLRISCPPGLARYLGSQTLGSFLARHPNVRVFMDLTSRRVDIIREGYDVAFRIDLKPESDLSLTMRQIGRSRRMLVASPDYLEQVAPITIETLPQGATLTIGDHVDHDRWDLVNDAGERSRVVHRPRLCSNDSMIIREAALDGLGVALLHEQNCVADIESGRLSRVLPNLHTLDGLVHMIFATRQGMPAAQRAFIDHYASQSFFPEAVGS